MCQLWKRKLQEFPTYVCLKAALGDANGKKVQEDKMTSALDSS